MNARRHLLSVRRGGVGSNFFPGMENMVEEVVVLWLFAVVRDYR